MTTTESTTRPSEHNITRRKMLQSVAATTVASMVVPVGIKEEAQAVEPVHPWQRARDLARELSRMLAEIDDGCWFAEVYPKKEREYSVFFGNTAALEASQATSAAANSELVALGAEYEQIQKANRKLLPEMHELHQKWGDEIKSRMLNWDTQMPEIEAIEECLGLTSLQARNDAYCDRMGAIERRARELSASTFAGVRAKFIIARGTLGPDYADVGSRDDQDWDVMLLNEFADDLTTLARATRGQSGALVAEA